MAEHSKTFTVTLTIDDAVYSGDYGPIEHEIEEVVCALRKKIHAWAEPFTIDKLDVPS